MSSSSSSSGEVLQMVYQTIVGVTDIIERANSLREDNEAESAIRKKRKYIQRDRAVGHDRLVHDYFAENALFEGYNFRRRFRMQKSLFLRIVDDMRQSCPYFEQREDARGTLGFSPIQKCVAAMRQLAYGTQPDALDENLRMSARTARINLHKFCKYVARIYGPRYLRAPTYNDIQQLYAHHSEVHGFPGMLESLDCLHWPWANCSNALKGQYTRGDHGEPTVILEAVASQDLWFWHAYFGSLGSLNDINVLNNSPIFNGIYDGTAPDSSFQVHGTWYRYGYYLVDGIYPNRSVLVKSFTCPDDQKRLKFKRAQERARKDVERALGALKKRFHIIKRPALFFSTDLMEEVMYACIILHNMILEDEGRSAVVYDEDEVIPPTVPFPNASQEYLENRQVLRNAEIHHNLRHDLVEHIYTVTHVDLNVEPVDDLDGQFSDEDAI